MAHTYSQNLEARFNTLQSNFTETQQEVRHLSANIATINKNMHSSITTSIEELKEDIKQDITTQLESIASMICTKLHIPADPPLSNPPLHTDAETSSHSHNFHPHHFLGDLRLACGCDQI
jgi:phage-related minor tail protein